jgi:hypothetical protein
MQTSSVGDVSILSKVPLIPKSYPGMEMMLARTSCLARYVLLLTLNKALPGGCPIITISQRKKE